jgi:photosystem II cytochrome c550
VKDIPQLLQEAFTKTFPHVDHDSTDAIIKDESCVSFPQGGREATFPQGNKLGKGTFPLSNKPQSKRRTFLKVIPLIFLPWAKPANSTGLTESLRTLPYDEKGGEMTLTLAEVKRGKLLFNKTCGTCHVGGISKTNQNVGLDLASLRSALPSRDNIRSLVNYIKDPRSLDGRDSLALTHPCTKNADLFPKMRTLTEEDLVQISGHILLQAKVGNERWGGGKIYY